MIAAKVAAPPVVVAEVVAAAAVVTITVVASESVGVTRGSCGGKSGSDKSMAVATAVPAVMDQSKVVVVATAVVWWKQSGRGKV